MQKIKKTLLWLYFDPKRGGTGWDWEKKKNSTFRSIHSRHGVGISKKIAKKLKKLENINIASSQAKTGRERLRTWEKKILVLIHSNPTRNKEFQKDSKNIQKIKKHHYGFFSCQNGTGEVENVRKKKLSFWSIQTWLGIGNSKKIAKKFKKLKNINMASFQAKTGRERLRMWEKKNSHSDPFQPDPE